MFLTKTDFDSAIHSEIIDAITRQDETILPILILEAIGKMKSYLSERFDCNVIFAKTGEDRDPVIMSLCKDIVLYDLHCIHNPRKMTKRTVDRYNNAIEWLKGIVKNEINPGLPEAATPVTPVKFGSNPKRNNFF